MTQFYNLFSFQANKEIESVNTLLEVSKEKRIPPNRVSRKQRKVDQYASLLLKETPRLNSWKICESQRPHEIDYISDETFNLQKHMYRSDRFSSGVSLPVNTKRPKRCGFDETDKGKIVRRIDTGVTKSLCPKEKESTYKFKHSLSIDGQIKRYRKEVTHKIIADYVSVILLDKTSISLGKHGLYCCPHLLSLFKAKTRQQKPITKASFIYYNLDFDEQNGMQNELGCLRVGPAENGYIYNEDTKQSSKKDNACSIPSITLPSLREFIDHSKSNNSNLSTGEASSCSKKPKSHPSSAQRPKRRSTSVLKYLRPKVPQAAMPKKEKGFYACIMPVRTKSTR